jgi:hypothetical protein
MMSWRPKVAYFKVYNQDRLLETMHVLSITSYQNSFNYIFVISAPQIHARIVYNKLQVKSVYMYVSVFSLI